MTRAERLAAVVERVDHPATAPRWLASATDDRAFLLGLLREARAEMAAMMWPGRLAHGGLGHSLADCSACILFAVLVDALEKR